MTYVSYRRIVMTRFSANIILEDNDVIINIADYLELSTVHMKVVIRLER